MAVNVVKYGDRTLVDMRDATATPDTILAGYTAYGADGARITGTAVPLQRLEKSVVLPNSGWVYTEDDYQQTVSVSGVPGNATIFVSGSETCRNDYDSCGIICTGQQAGKLTFRCDTLPGEDLTAIVAMIF